MQTKDVQGIPCFWHEQQGRDKFHYPNSTIHMLVTEAFVHHPDCSSVQEEKATAFETP